MVSFLLWNHFLVTPVFQEMFHIFVSVHLIEDQTVLQTRCCWWNFNCDHCFPCHVLFNGTITALFFQQTMHWRGHHIFQRLASFIQCPISNTINKSFKDIRNIICKKPRWIYCMQYVVCGVRLFCQSCRHFDC